MEEETWLCEGFGAELRDAFYRRDACKFEQLVQELELRQEDRIHAMDEDYLHA